MLAQMQVILGSIVIVLFVVEVNCQDPWANNNMKAYCHKEQYKKTIEKLGCRKESFQISACLGLCRSYTEPLPHQPYFKNHCQCCQFTQQEVKQLRLSDCDPGVDPVIKIASAIGCDCQTNKC